MNDTTQRDKKVQRIILVEGLANLFVLILKTLVGLSTGSMAILADAIHSLTDITNNIIAWVVMHYSNKPADREHPYGHKKFETLAVFILASLLIVIAFEISVNAIQKEVVPVKSSKIELFTMACVLLVNILITSWEQMWAKRLDSDILRADATHTFADILTTVVVIAGWQLSARGYIWVDRLCALGVALIVVYLAYKLFMRALPILVDEYAIDPEKLGKSIKKVPGVKNVYRIRSRWIGKNSALDLVISVEPTLTTEESHSIADQVESLIEKEFQVTDISIHVEPDGQ